MKADKSNFWRSHKRVASKFESPRESVVSVRKSGSVIARNKSEEYAIALLIVGVEYTDKMQFSGTSYN
jgi:phosphoinositide-3-kinase, regulatory subunit 4